ncbi:MAG: hypothetical protein J7L61_04335 [Thermoplasmata archaeon]|nr:hypothetical protein [Thermoplasmata archaeon]
MNTPADRGPEGRGWRPVRYREARMIPAVERRSFLISLVVLLILLSAVGYYFFFPRLSVEVETWYCETMLGGIKVDLTVRNNAPVVLEDVDILLSVENDSGDVVASSAYTDMKIEKWEDRSLAALSVPPDALKYNTHLDNYTIRISVSLDYRGQPLFFEFHHRTKEPYMNLFYRDKIG